MFKSLLLSGSVLSVLGGCAQPAIDTAPVSQADFAAWQGKGTATVKGSATLLLNGGGLRTCAGQNAILVPANDYDLNIFSQNRASNRIVIKAGSPLVYQNLRVTTCGPEGHFEFDDVPAKAWIVTADVAWTFQHGIFVDYHGGMLGRVQKLHPGVNHINLNRSDFAIHSSP